MDRREFSKRTALLGTGLLVGCNAGAQDNSPSAPVEGMYHESGRNLPIREFDVVVAGGGTAGVVAALAAARTGAKTALIEIKGYTGGTITEGGTALHSFYNLWKAFEGVEKRQVIKGIPQEIINELIKVGGCSGHAEMMARYDYDSVCTAIDVEQYKLTTMEMLEQAGVFMALHTRVAGAVVEKSVVKGVITESRSGREVFAAKSFIDCTAFGDLSAYAGAKYTVPNDYGSCNSVGIGNVDVEKYLEFTKANNKGTPREVAYGWRSGRDGQIVRVDGPLGPEFSKEAGKIGMAGVTTTVHDNYFMFIKCNYTVPGSVLNRDDMSKAELVVRRNMAKAVELFKKYVPGCEKAFMARTSPMICIRRGRQIVCDYDVTHEDVIEGRHFEDDVLVYGFHDMAPRYQVKNGGTYGLPYRALCVAGLDNLYAAGMLITSDHRAHMSTRNTVCSMAQGQATGTAAALCVQKKCGSRQLSYPDLRKRLESDGVYFES
jgi:hypothetical protein